jgi:hypothetical protein
MGRDSAINNSTSSTTTLTAALTPLKKNSASCGESLLSVKIPLSTLRLSGMSFHSTHSNWNNESECSWGFRNNWPLALLDIAPSGYWTVAFSFASQHWGLRSRKILGAVLFELTEDVRPRWFLVHFGGHGQLFIFLQWR